jgi:RimJ/RimL family protein N-acetyltransferase
MDLTSPGMRIRPLTKDDLETVRRLRNDSRDAFFDNREISAEDQARWFERLRDRPVAFYVLEVDGRVVGTISITETAAGREIGNLVLDPAYRGRGLMQSAVAQLTTEPGSYVAEVKPGNEPSLRVFTSTEFEPDMIRLRKRVE